MHVHIGPQARGLIAESAWVLAGCRTPDGRPVDAPAVHLAGGGPEVPGVLVAVPETGPGQRLALRLDGGSARLEPAEDGLPFVEAVLDAVVAAYGRRVGGLAGRRIVVTSGGTREPMDPVRFITNRSSGKMGFALASAARDRGAEVTYIATSAQVPAPAGVRVVLAPSVAQLRAAVLEATGSAHVLVMAAAVSDFRPAAVASGKIKKGPSGMSLALETVANFVPEVPAGVLRVGFAAETDSDLDRAAAKMRQRGFDLLCLNDVSRPGVGFEVDTNKVWILDGTGVRVETDVLPKSAVAHRILDEVEAFLHVDATL
ncbi:phosphopantothenoylcysteine decarboxylase [Catellatospora sp. TT07R-123]|uniref:phosphopantothenoylcysteine decarboxylase domain-containing protein n=1 Tax=Catellatospora sp. TT07R-123 TaxID=2733863 RepID=UPI001BB40CEA|nr:phosphopantothenoylcysteine decarboxylase [Catellatospora sp. TT07R-123]